MESLEAILKMNEKHPPGRRSRCITDLCARVEELEKALNEERDERRRKASELIGGGPLTPGELEGDYVLPKSAGDHQKPHQPAPAPTLATSAQTAAHDALNTAEARSGAYLASIRRLAERGRLATSGQVLWLCEQVEQAERNERRLTADVGAWWWIVNDLEQLGCLDCSNNACDR